MENNGKVKNRYRNNPLIKALLSFSCKHHVENNFLFVFKQQPIILHGASIDHNKYHKCSIHNLSVPAGAHTEKNNMDTCLKYTF